MLSDFGRSKIINQPGFTTPTRVGSLRYFAPELLIQSDESDDDVSFITKKTDVYAFSMVGVEVNLFQITHIPGSDGYYIDFVWTTTLPQHT